MRKTIITALGALTVLTGGCAHNRAGPVDVTRYHLGTPIERNSYALESLKTTDSVSPEYKAYADAVSAQLDALGFTSAGSADNSQYVAAISFRRAPIGVVEKQSPFSIGIGGGTGGRSGGVGGGLNLGLGGGQQNVIATELAVQIRRRSDDTTIWEGRAITQTVGEVAPGETNATPQKLASALFKGFPGESGITITVK